MTRDELFEKLRPYIGRELTDAVVAEIVYRAIPEPALRQNLQATVEKGQGRPYTDQGNHMQEVLQALPIDVRAQVIADLFRVIATEFASMVLEYVKEPEKRDLM